MFTFDALYDAKKELIILFISLGLFVSLAAYNTYLDRMEIEEEIKKTDWFNLNFLSNWWANLFLVPDQILSILHLIQPEEEFF